MRDLASEVVNDLKVLPAGVKDLQYLLVVDEQIEERLEIDVGLGIDPRSFFAACNLDQAEVRPIAILAHELSVHGDERLAGKTVDECPEVVGLSNQRMDTHESSSGFSGPLAG